MFEVCVGCLLPLDVPFHWYLEPTTNEVVSFHLACAMTTPLTTDPALQAYVAGSLHTGNAET